MKQLKTSKLNIICAPNGKWTKKFEQKFPIRKVCLIRIFSWMENGLKRNTRFNTRNKQNCIWLSVEGIGGQTNSSGTLFLNRDRGGLGILVPLIQGQALRIKYLLQLEKENNNNIWTYLGRYWLSSKIHNFTPHWQFLRNNVTLKNYDSYVPDCYSDTLPLTRENINDIFVQVKRTSWIS